MPKHIIKLFTKFAQQVSGVILQSQVTSRLNSLNKLYSMIDKHEAVPSIMPQESVVRYLEKIRSQALSTDELNKINGWLEYTKDILSNEINKI